MYFRSNIRDPVYIPNFATKCEHEKNSIWFFESATFSKWNEMKNSWQCLICRAFTWIHLNNDPQSTCFLTVPLFHFVNFSTQTYLSSFVVFIWTKSSDWVKFIRTEYFVSVYSLSLILLNCLNLMNFYTITTNIWAIGSRLKRPWTYI